MLAELRRGGASMERPGVPLGIFVLETESWSRHGALHRLLRARPWRGCTVGRVDSSCSLHPIVISLVTETP